MTVDIYTEWRELIRSGPVGLREVDSASPFRRLYGVDDSHRAQFVMFFDSEPVRPPISAAVDVAVGFRERDEQWTLALTLVDLALTEVFLQLSVDLVRRTRLAMSSAEGLELVLLGLDEWRRALNPTPARHLSEEELRGLVAELWVAVRILSPGRSMADVTRGWLGPFGSPQDFTIDGASFEVKAVRQHATKVAISSAAQLSADGDLELCCLVLADAGPDDPGAFSLPGLAAELIRGSVIAGGTDDEVVRRLARLGVDLADRYYASRLFSAGHFIRYDVSGDFPCVRAESLPLGVANVTYTIDLSAMAPYRKPTVPSELLHGGEV